MYLIFVGGLQMEVCLCDARVKIGKTCKGLNCHWATSLLRCTEITDIQMSFFPLSLYFNHILTP